MAAAHFKVDNVVAIVDTNCNPEAIDYPIPANDDPAKAVRLICGKIAEAVLEGKAIREQAEASEEIFSEKELPQSLGTLSFTPEEA